MKSASGRRGDAMARKMSKAMCIATIARYTKGRQVVAHLS